MIVYLFNIAELNHTKNTTGGQSIGGSSGVPPDGGLIELLITGAAVAGLTKTI